MVREADILNKLPLEVAKKVRERWPCLGTLQSVGEGFALIERLQKMVLAFLDQVCKKGEQYRSQESILVGWSEWLTTTVKA